MSVFHSFFVFLLKNRNKNINFATMIGNSVSTDQEQDRRKLLSGFLYDMAKLMFGSVAIGGLSPLFTGTALGVINIICLISGSLCGTFLAYCANSIMKIKK